MASLRTTDTDLASSGNATDVYTTYVEEEFGATEMGRTSTGQRKRQRKNKILWGTTGVIVAAVLIAAIVGVTMLSIKKSRALRDQTVEEIVDTFPADSKLSPSMKLSPDAAAKLLKLNTDAKEAAAAAKAGKKMKGYIDNLEVVRNAINHMQETGDANKDWFRAWSDLTEIALEQTRLGMSTEKGKKMNASQYGDLANMKMKGDSILAEIVKQMEEDLPQKKDPEDWKDDIGKINRCREFSVYSFNFLDSKLRKNKEIKPLPKIEGVEEKPKKNKDFAKFPQYTQAAYMDVCLLRLAKLYSGWELDG